MSDENIILRWSGVNPHTGRVESWYIRGIRPDGSFYGEIRIEDEGTCKLTNLERTLSSRENEELRMLVSDLSKYDPRTRLDNTTCDGIIGLGQVTHPHVILRFSVAKHEGTEISTKFQRVIELIRQHT